MRHVLAAAGLLTAAALALVYLSPGLAPWARTALGTAQLVLVGVFIAERARRLLLARRAKQFLLDHWMDLSLLGAAALLVALGLAAGGRFLPAAAMYVLLSRSWLLVPRRRLPVALNVLLALTGAVAVAALVLEFGFHAPPVDRNVLHAVQTVVVAVFILDRIVRLESAPSRPAYLRDNWVDFGLMVVAAVAVTVTRHLHGEILSAGALYVIITQVYILISLVLRGVSVSLDVAGSGVHSTWLLIGSFAAMCLVGSGLLTLPAATQITEAPTTQAGAQSSQITRQLGEPISYVDALFTATSATCVTGLVVRNTGADFTPFGQAVILGLIQMGGLGIMLFGTMLALLVGKGLTFRSSEALGEMIGTEGIGRIARIVKFVVAVAIGFEVLGAVLLYPMFASAQGPAVPETGRALWDSVFHSVSSFCNAGFALYGRNMMAGAPEGWSQPLRGHWQILGVMAPLIVMGGLGFPVIEDCAKYFRSLLVRLVGRAFPSGRRRMGRAPRLSLHSKTVLSVSAALIVAGAAGLLLLGPSRRTGGQQIGRVPLAGPDGRVQDHPSRWRNMPTGGRIGAALFQSVSARTAGFNTIDMRDDLSDASRLWICGLMIVGGSPASTAGGVKTVTIAILLLAAWSMIRRRNAVEAFKRTIPVVLLRRAVTLFILYLALVGTVTLLLCVATPGGDFMRLLFEACSACGTVGLSTGITPSLSMFGKIIVIVGMFAGRLGPLTLLLALTARMRHVRYSYPSENLVIG
jgi:trk system potassium uptake protein TrkH